MPLIMGLKKLLGGCLTDWIVRPPHQNFTVASQLLAQMKPKVAALIVQLYAIVL